MSTCTNNELENSEMTTKIALYLKRTKMTFATFRVTPLHSGELDMRGMGEIYMR